ncbi:unnamed protein product [Lactuca virosa]|uniref:Bifunctional inhibitor/plant lipid transfer protein/seed storage helical domain-containing protein n=1 Tax=Lactuca virosa TaxID=75947 RepID=A0AAU9NCH8_9ASTR|nr:unnamed protein product [Lactuca virosa]
MAQSGCTTALIGLAPCLTFVSGNASIPSASCCSQLSNVVQGQPQCLCSLLNGGGPNLGISINQTLALSLPMLVMYNSPGVANGPTSSVADSPTSKSPSDSSSNETRVGAPTSTSTPTIPDVGVPTTTTTPTSPDVSSVPSTNNDGSDATIIREPTRVLVVAFLVATCASIVTKF